MNIKRSISLAMIVATVGSLALVAGAQADRVYVSAQDTTGNDNSGASCPASSFNGIAPFGTVCAPTVVNVSLNGGSTWATPKGVKASPPGTRTIDGPSKPVVNSDGSVSVAWRTVGVTGMLQTPTGKIQIARSTDQGQTWGTPVDVTDVTNTGTSTATHVPPTPPATTGASTSASYPRIVKGNEPGRLYMVYSQGGPGPTACAGCWTGSDHFISPDSDVWFQRSLNNGVTWSTPKKINDDTQRPGAQLVQTRHASVSVSPSGRINVVWHDRRHWYQERLERTCSHSHIYCSELRLGDTYLSYSDNGGATFSANVRVNDRSLNSEVGFDARPSTYWNYSPVAVTTANNRLLVGWMDSREGNWDTDKQDIYLAKVDFDAPATSAAPRTFVDRPDAVARSVALSQLAYPAGSDGGLNGVSTRNVTNVVIVNQTDVAGALAGSVLARANPGPVLLSTASGLPASVSTEVARMTPVGAFIIGDTTKLSAQVETDLANAGVPANKITRISGADDAATAAAVAAAMDRRADAEKTADQSAFDAAVIANPASPDAAAAAGLAAARRLPFLFVGSNSVPQATTDAIASLDINQTLVIGGTSVVGNTTGLPNLTRLGGSDQYGTSQSVVNESKARGLPGNVGYVADGAQPMDGALLAGAVARSSGIMLLAPAPLHSTAAAQATAFGLTTGNRLIDRLVLVGPSGPTSAGGAAGLRVGPNYRLNSDANPFRGNDAPSLAVNPNNPSHVVQVNANYLTQQCEGTRSLDGGETWSPAAPLVPAPPPAPLVGWLEACGTFQSIEFGAGNTVYTAGAAARVSLASDEGASVLLFKSTDGGLNWGQGTVAMAGGPGDVDLGLEPEDGPSFFRPSLSVVPVAPATNGGGGDTGGGDTGGGDTGGGGGDSGGGGGVGSSTGPDTTPASVTGVSMTRTRFRAAAARASQRAPIGTTIRFTLSEAARVSIVVAKPLAGRRRGTRCVRPTRALRRARRCTRLQTRGTVVNARRAQGASSVQFSGRFGRRALAPGRYQFTLSATDDAGNKSRPVVRTFTIVR